MKRSELLNVLDRRILVFDGAMGTMLQAKGCLAPGELPELLNLRDPAAVSEVHREYLEVGCDLIQTNTFGGNRIKLADFGLEQKVQEINQRAVAIARQAAAGTGARVVGSIGPTGKLLAPYGEADFAEIYAAYYEQAEALVRAGVDLLNIETQSDIHEAKIAVMAAKAAGGDIAVICSLTYDTSLRTLTGTDPETAVSVLSSLGVAVVGTNCGFGPEFMAPVLARQHALADSYLLAQPNAGLPEQIAGKTVYRLSPEEMAAYVPKLVEAGANMVGGCCGTTPEHMRLIVAQARRLAPLPRTQNDHSTLSSASRTVSIGSQLPTPIIGERINPTARKRLANSLRQGDFSLVAAEARQQVASGAQILDVNVGIGLTAAAEAELMASTILAVQNAVQVPLAIDTTNVLAMESGLCQYRGKPLLNSVNGSAEVLTPVLGLAARYGAAVLGLTLDERGIPATANERLAIARSIVDAAIKSGIRRQDIYIDTLTLTAGAEQAQVVETLRAIRMVKQELGVKTILGVSNISYGLPCRSTINNSFLAMALAAGLDLPIINPLQEGVGAVLKSSDLLIGRDQSARIFVDWAGSADTALALSRQEPTPASTPEVALREHIKQGEKTQLAGLVEELLAAGWPAMQIIDDCVISALDKVGELYTERVFFLPQLLLSAAAAEHVFQLLQKELANEESATHSGVIVIATVAGDIHDIGKNIVALMLRNHGFKVIDLGKDVSSERIVATAQAEQADLVGLSALMTTTMPGMADVVAALRVAGLQIPVLVGGAVVTPAYADSIGAHYAADATLAVKLAQELICDNGREKA